MRIATSPTGRGKNSSVLPLLRRFSWGNGMCSPYYTEHRRQSTLTSSALSSPANHNQQVVYRSIRDCRERAFHLIQELVSSPIPGCGLSYSTNGSFGGPSLTVNAVSGVASLLELYDKAYYFLHLLHRTILVPRNVVRDTDDFTEFLLRCFRRPSDSLLKGDEELQLSDAAIVDGFVEWMETSLMSAGQFVSFVEVLQLVGSYVRYHKGVRWGARPSEEEWYRCGYRLHPWHDTYCPSSRAEQMPYVHLLQWLMRAKPTKLEEKIDDKEGAHGASSLFSTAAKESAMRAWYATEEFSPPSWHTVVGNSNRLGFTALDCGCHSGYMTELLLKAGAQEVLGVDVSPHHLRNAEATLSEHLRERRSSSYSRKTVEFVRCDILPDLPDEARQTKTPPLGPEGSTNSAAAENRRRLARCHHMPSDSDGLKTETEVTGPFDLLLFHPPLPLLFPTWPLFHDLYESVDQLAYDAGRRHPHCRLSVLNEFLQRLLGSSNGEENNSERRRNAHQQLKHQRRLVAPLIKDNGYVAFILPRNFDTRAILQRMSTSSAGKNCTSCGSDGLAPLVPLSDVVTMTLEGSYTLVLKRSHSLSSLLNRMDYIQKSISAFIRAFVSPQHRSRVEQEVRDFYSNHQAIDLIVMRKIARQKTNEDNDNKDCSVRAVLQKVSEPIAYEDSFEYEEYIPAGGSPLAHHWTEMTPSFSYLEDEFFGCADSVGTNGPPNGASFLAVGHPLVPVTRQLVGVDRFGAGGRDATQGESGSFDKMFAKEMRRRGGRMRKMALTPLEKQEWYIDEKLVKSEAAKVDLMNELSRFELKDFD
ncbi:methyltransferase domain containing protein, putative [Trypanosoma equiperdum]|uniref:Methyltransferase domain containing protein, putative n=1 Tax=Trypanosoma equiperdum TaxID=5694 RepID=A0A1G4IJ60_TRYEQ|nr:methyltransferase domain containing protein, putative [Trypanosoma equiperdum]